MYRGLRHERVVVIRHMRRKRQRTLQKRGGGSVDRGLFPPTSPGQRSGLFVWIVSAMTVTKVVEGCVYIRRRYHGILPRVGGEFEGPEFEHSALSPLSLRSLSLALSSNATTLNHLIRLQGSQGIQIWKQRTRSTW